MTQARADRRPFSTSIENHSGTPEDYARPQPPAYRAELQSWRCQAGCMAPPDPKADLKNYLQGGRETLLWKLDGLSEYDIRRPLVPTGTNLLGLVKHKAGSELVYFGDTF